MGRMFFRYAPIDHKPKLIETAKAHLKAGQKLQAAQAFTQAEAFADAAELYESLEDFGRAAILHAKDGNYAMAGEMFARAGDLRHAAEAFEKGGQFELAVPIYKNLGEIPKVIGILERQGLFFDAAMVCHKRGMPDEGIVLCQKIPPPHVDFARSRLLLAHLFSEKGHNDLALKAFHEAVAADPRLEKERPAFEPKKTAGPPPPKEPRYELLDELGRSAMGVVYKAKDRLLDRIVAFKTLPRALKDDPSALENLIKEAQTAAKLNHPNIVTIYDIGEEGGNYFLAMEYVEGKTLAQVLKQIKKVNLESFFDVAKILCNVVAYAHKHRVIHRDIKPSNILLLPDRTVKLTDFGLAKILQKISIDKTMLRGTPLYMSPEQILGKDIDHRTDIYSLGVCFYEMLVGRPPFKEGNILKAHLETPPPPIQELAPGLPDAVARTIMSCLEKEKNKRPATAKDLAKGLGIA